MSASVASVSSMRIERESQRVAGRIVGPREWILSIYGNFVREFGGWIAVADLLELLETFGSAPTASRAAISRMKRNNELQSESRDGRSGYSLTAAAEEWFRDGSERILRPTPAPETTSWALASFSVPEQDRSSRYKIRARLKGLGFGQVSAGLMIVPVAVFGEAQRALVRSGLDEYVVLWEAEHRGFGPASTVVSDAWDLPAIRSSFDEYCRIASDLASRPAPTSARQSFIDYMAAMHAWRELPFLDPGLPTSLLPDDWPAADALRLFVEISERLRAPAWRYAITVMTAEE